MHLIPSVKGLPEPIAFETFLTHLGHSVGIGVLLMAVTLLTSWPIAKEDTEEKANLSDLTLESGNLIFLCAGITGVMVLVNNDIARAFAIGAAIALVRFRVRMEKATASGYFFALIAGMACGVDSLDIGWALATVYSILKITVYFGTRIARRMDLKRDFVTVGQVAAPKPLTTVLPAAVEAPVTSDTPAAIKQSPASPRA